MSTLNPPGAPPPIRSWSDGYAAIRRRAGETRGWIELDGDGPDRRWPRTTGLDVIVIGAFIDGAIHNVDPTSQPAILWRWSPAKDDLERDALGALGETYRGNRAFWSTVAKVVAQLAHLGCPLPPQVAWHALLAGIGELLPTVLATDAPPLWFAGVDSLDKLYQAQRQYLANTRGADRRDPSPGMPGGGGMIIPRTTNADALQLARFWSALLRLPQARAASGYTTASQQWRAALDQVAKLTAYTSPTALYPQNHVFWRALAQVAAHVATAFGPGLDDPELRGALDAQLNRRRNGAPPQDRPPVWFASASSLDKLYLAQRNYLANLRGSDRLAPEADMTGGTMIVPRSTNADVLQLAAFWTQALREPKATREAGYETVRARWSAIQRNLEAHARGADPNAVYPKNHAFWRTAASVAVHVAASLQYGLSDAQRWMASIGESLQGATDRAKELASAVASGVRETVADVAHGAGKIINEGARGLLGGIGTPLLIGGGALAAFLLLRQREPARTESTS